MKYLQQFADNAQYINYLSRGGVDADLKERLLGKIDESIYNREPFTIEGKSDTEVNSLTIYFNGSTTATEVIPIYDSASKMYSYKTFDNVTRVQVPTTTTELVKLNHTKELTSMGGMFYFGNRLSSLDVSDWDTSNVTNMTMMFNVCTKLATLNISNFDTSNVTNMRWMFERCLSITSLDVSSFDTSKVTNMGQMFGRCSSLTSLDVSSFDTSKVTDMYYMFQDCSSLTSLSVSNFDTSNVTDMGSMFSDCENLASLDLSSFDTSNVTNMNSMFADCSNLTSLNIGKFDMSKVTRMTSMFYRSSKLSKVNGIFSGIKVNLDLSYTKLVNVDNFFNGLDTVATTQTLTLPKTAVYTDEQVAAANDKGWTIAQR